MVERAGLTPALAPRRGGGCDALRLLLTTVPRIQSWVFERASEGCSLSWVLIITHNFFELSDVSISATNWCCHSYSCESTTVPLRRMSWLLRYCGPCTGPDRNPRSRSRLHRPNRRIG